jgi:hypothetical protein
MFKYFMNINFSSCNSIYFSGGSATHPLMRPRSRLALSRFLAGMSLPRCRFAPVTRPNAPSGTPNNRPQLERKS